MRRSDFVRRRAAYYEDVDRHVLAVIRIGSRRGRFCCRAKIHAALFVLAWEFEELAHLRSPSAC